MAVCVLPEWYQSVRKYRLIQYSLDVDRFFNGFFLGPGCCVMHLKKNEKTTSVGFEPRRPFVRL